MKPITDELIQELRESPHNSWGETLLKVYNLAKDKCTQKGQIVELGAATGITSVMLLKAAREKKAEFVSFDIDENCKYGYLNSFPDWQLIILDSVEAAERFNDNSVDVVLLDTSHEYEPTLRELEVWCPKLRVNGIMILHDTWHANYPGVLKALKETFVPFDETKPVVILSDDLKYTYHHIPQCIANSGERCGMGVIRRIED